MRNELMHLEDSRLPSLLGCSTDVRDVWSRCHHLDLGRVSSPGESWLVPWSVGCVLGWEKLEIQGVAGSSELRVGAR